MKIKHIKILAIIVAFLGIIAFVDPIGGWYILPVTISIGALIYSIACITEMLLPYLKKDKNNDITNKDSK
jgi:hypothetical protein